MPICKTVKFLSLFEQLFGRLAVTGKRPFFSGLANILPAMIEGRLEPDARQAALFDQQAIGLDRPRSASKRKDPAIRIGQGGSQACRLDRTVVRFAIVVDYVCDPPSIGIFDQTVQIQPTAAKKLCQMAGDARFADTHKAGQCDSDISFIRGRRHEKST